MIARHGLRDVVDADAAELVLSELVANALQHAYHDKPSLADTVHIGIGPWRDGLLISAGDMSDETPTVRSASHEAESGRGLHVIGALSAEWGWAPQDGGGKVVYALIPDGGTEDMRTAR